MVRISDGETGTVTAGGSDGEGEGASPSTPCSGTEASSSTALTSFRRLWLSTAECLKEAAERRAAKERFEGGREIEGMEIGD